MAPTHRALVASLPPRDAAPSLVALDGSYDFQTNRAEMGEKIAVYFRSKVGIPTTVVGLPEPERDGADLPPAAFAPTIALFGCTKTPVRLETRRLVLKISVVWMLV